MLRDHAGAFDETTLDKATPPVYCTLLYSHVQYLYVCCWEDKDSRRLGGCNDCVLAEGPGRGRLKVAVTHRCDAVYANDAKDAAATCTEDAEMPRLLPLVAEATVTQGLWHGGATYPGARTCCTERCTMYGPRSVCSIAL